MKSYNPKFFRRLVGAMWGGRPTNQTALCVGCDTATQLLNNSTSCDCRSIIDGSSSASRVSSHIIS
ncbi:hypothetical protein IJ135_01810 [Candidatus Saccharibacteria bacterium]|nr:hypothetical protein [Candidatus Saccharibacteria bacterium]